MTPDSKSVRRWSFGFSIFDEESETLPRMAMCPDGQYVLSEDHDRLIAEKDAEIAALRANNRELGLQSVEHHEELARLRASEEMLLTALRFYSEFANWNLFHQKGGDMGQRAREAIAEREKGRE